MNISQSFSDFLNHWLKLCPFGPMFQPSANYLLGNAGKFLRPLLVLNVAHDLKQIEKNHYWLALSIELHHSYTLIHDDLPCMDNDDMRRGKPTVHRVYGEAHALLLGDILLGKSFELLANISSPHLKEILKIFSFATGAKGLILGQKLDLDPQLVLANDREVLRMFELKTARLFQLSLITSILLTSEKDNLHLIRQSIKMGSICGILFQLLDDYHDWHTDKKSDFNFFQKKPEQAKKLLISYQDSFAKLSNELQKTLPGTVAFLTKIYKDFH